jgi:hypothetical protein
MFGLLALHPDEQERLFQQTKEVLEGRQGVSGTQLWDQSYL